MRNGKELKAQVIQEIERHQSALIELSLRIHHNPELGFEELIASRHLVEYLENNGFDVETGYCGLSTAFRATFGTTPPVVAFVAEYDALPKLGHACGHNIIAAAAVGAGIGAMSAVKQIGGTVVVMGTPGEELYGGKAIMVKHGGFMGIDAAMMIHPSGQDNAIVQSLGCATLDVEFFGKATHAAAFPQDGINALDAMILSFNGINSLRQHCRDGSRIHGIITSGGEAANVVPDYTAGKFLVRSSDMQYLEELKEKVLNCFVAASVATGAKIDYTWGEVTYAFLRTNVTLAKLFCQNMEAAGRHVSLSSHSQFGSTDMGNVSQVVPSIHPLLSIVHPGVSEHSPEFADAAASEQGHRALLDGAKALALTFIDVTTDPTCMKKVKDEFAKQHRNNSKG